jgi:drug/metabolite transporter (DMT)-like permease
MFNKAIASPSVQMVLATVLFACMGVCVKLASAHFGTAAVVSARGLVGAVIMGGLLWRSATPVATQVPRLHVQRGVAGVTALSLWFYGIGHLPLSTAVTLNYMSSVWIAVFLLLRALLMRNAQVDLRLVGAIGIGFVGVAMVLHPTLARDQLFAGLLGLASGLLAATAYVQVRALCLVGEPEVRVVFWFSVMGTFMGALIWLLPGQGNRSELADIPWETWLALVGVGAFATVAQLLMTRAYAQGAMLVNASLQYLGIVHAFIVGIVWFDEPVTPSAVLGAALIVLAGVWATWLSGGRRARPAR